MPISEKCLNDWIKDSSTNSIPSTFSFKKRKKKRGCVSSEWSKNAINTDSKIASSWASFVFMNKNEHFCFIWKPTVYIYIYIYIYSGLEVSVFAKGLGNQGSVLIESYQRLKKWYLMPLCLTLSIIKYGSRVKWSNPGKWVAPFPASRCSSYWKGSLRVALDYSCQQQIVFSSTKLKDIFVFNHLLRHG